MCRKDRAGLLHARETGLSKHQEEQYEDSPSFQWDTMHPIKPNLILAHEGREPKQEDPQRTRMSSISARQLWKSCSTVRREEDNQNPKDCRAETKTNTKDTIPFQQVLTEFECICQL